MNLRQISIEYDSYQDLLDFKIRENCKTFADAISLMQQRLGEDHYRRHKIEYNRLG